MIKIELTEDQARTVVDGLSLLPFIRSAMLIQKVSQSIIDGRGVNDDAEPLTVKTDPVSVPDKKRGGAKK